MYETMWLHEQEYLCTIPIVDMVPRNETSEAEARVAEQKELARANDRGGELLQDLEGQCMYFLSGWWSYSFCYNAGVTQFHQLPPQPGRPAYPPQRDPNTKEYVLGRAKPKRQNNKGAMGNEMDVHKGVEAATSLTTELQVKGDTRYLVQKMEDGDECDLTGKPRRVEIQYHCKPQSGDKIGWIKEVTTCEYLMVVHTPRLCSDVAFMPPKETKANLISCSMVLPDEDITYWEDLKALEAESNINGESLQTQPLNVGGIIVGGGKYVAKDGEMLPVPANWGTGAQNSVADIIARSTGGSENWLVEILSKEALEKLDLDPEAIEQLKTELQKIVGDKGWKLEVVDVPGEKRKIRVIMDGDGEEEEKPPAGDSEKGSEEEYKEEL